METYMGVLINTRSFGERLSDITTRGALIITSDTKKTQESVEKFLVEHSFIGKFADENDQKVVFKWTRFDVGHIWFFGKNDDLTDFESAPDYAREIIFSPAFYVYLPATIITQAEE